MEEDNDDQVQGETLLNRQSQIEQLKQRKTQSGSQQTAHQGHRLMRNSSGKNIEDFQTQQQQQVRYSEIPSNHNQQDLESEAQSQPNNRRDANNIQQYKERIARLEKQLLEKDKSIASFRKQYQEMVQNYQEAQLEIQQLRQSRHSSFHQQQLPNQQPSDLPWPQTEQENQKFKRKIQENDNVIQQLQDEVEIYQQKLEISQEKLEQSEMRLLQFEKENRRLQREDVQKSQHLSDFQYKYDLLSEENAKMQMKIEQLSMINAGLEGELQKKQNIDNILQDQEREFELRIQELGREQKKIYEENVNKILIDENYKYHLKKQRYLATIQELKSQLSQQQRQHQQQQHSWGAESIDFPSQKHSQVLTNLKYSHLQQPQQASSNINSLQKQLKYSTDRFSKLQNNYQNLSQKESTVFGPGPEKEEFLEILHQEFQTFDLRTLQQKIKELKKLADSLQKLITDCAPSQQQSLSYRQIWSLLKTILQKYMKLKMRKAEAKNQEVGDEDLIGHLQNQLKLEHRSQIPNQVYNLLIIRETSARVTSKVKRLLKCEWVRDVEELDKFLSNMDGNLQGLSDNAPNYYPDEEDSEPDIDKNNLQLDQQHQQQQQSQQQQLQQSGLHGGDLPGRAQDYGGEDEDEDEGDRNPVQFSRQFQQDNSNFKNSEKHVNLDDFQNIHEEE